MITSWLLLGLAAYCLAATCPANPHNLGPIQGQTIPQWKWDTATPTNTVDFTVCGLAAATCGADGTNNQCATKQNCCGSCQRWIDGDQTPQGACLGTVFSGISDNGAAGIALFYNGGDAIGAPYPPGPRQVYVNLTCDQTATGATIKPTAFKQPGTDGHPAGTPYVYFILAGTSAVCGGGGGPGPYGGAIFLILLFVGFFVYFVAGVVYNKFMQQKEGIELLPNSEFWQHSGENFVDGCRFTWAKITGLCGGRDSYSSVS